MKWLVFYLLLIPLYALLYQFLPSVVMEFNSFDETFLSMLAYSLAQITPYRTDIIPFSEDAVLLSMTETVMAVLLFIMFLRELFSVDREELLDELLTGWKIQAERVEQDHAKEQSRTEDRERLLSFDKVMSIYIERYLNYVVPVTTPRGPDQPEKVDESFSLKDMRDLFRSTGRLADHRSTPAIQYYFKALEEVMVKVEELVQHGYVSRWPELEQLCLQFLSVGKKLDFREQILQQLHAESASGKGVEVIERELSTHVGEVKFIHGNRLNPYVALHMLINESLKFVRHYQEQIDSIKSDVKQDVYKPELMKGD